MDTAVQARTATRNVVADIEPQKLRKVLFGRIDSASMAPGVLVFLSAQSAVPDIGFDGLAERSAGVQLIYEGLRLTRSIAQTEPWADSSDLTDTDIDADIDILAADILVSRGFYLLAQTDVAEAAVETVQSFGRDQTLRNRSDVDTETLDENLEADIFMLAVRAGLTAVDSSPSDDMLSFAVDLARNDVERLSAAEIVFSESTVSRLAELSDEVDGPVSPSPRDN